MDYQELVRNLFNDMFVFLNGTQPLGISRLQEVYQETPLFLAFIGNLDQALKVSFNEAMKNGYAFYKRYAGRELSDDDWDQAVTEIKEFMTKWQNDWCKQIILGLLELLENEDKARKGISEGTSLEERDMAEETQEAA